MYAVIHKEKVIIGPKGWDRGFFSFRFQQLKINAPTMPRRAPTEFPYIVDENTRIVPATVTYEEINTMTQYHRGPIWTIGEDSASALYEATDTPIEQAKSNFRNLAADERYNKEVAGTKTTIQDLEISLDTSRDGRNIFLQKFSLMGENDTVNWKFPEGWLTLTKSELGQIVQAGAEHIQSAFDWEKNINDQIDTETNINDLVKYEEIIKPKPQTGLEQNG
jgi:hypothetical protein